MDLRGVRPYVSEDLARQWGENVRRRRNELRLSMAEVEELSDGVVSAQAISKIECGRFVPRDHLKIVLGLLLRCRAADLFPMPEPERLERFTKSAVA